MQNSSARVIPFVYATFSLNINRSIQMNFISVPSSFLLYERMLNDLAEFLFQRFVRSFVFIHLSPISKMCSMKQKIAQVGKIRTFRWNSLCSSKQSFFFTIVNFTDNAKGWSCVIVTENIKFKWSVNWQ